MKDELIEEIAKAKEITKDYNKLKHLFSDDEGEAALAKLNQTLGRIGLLLAANASKDIAHPENRAIRKPLMGDQGCLVNVRPVGEEYEGKTYLGFLIGDIATGSSITMEGDKIQLNFSGYNPAIFVPELQKIIYGYESWWGIIEGIEDFKSITNEDIENVWYVKLWEILNKKRANKSEEKGQAEN